MDVKEAVQTAKAYITDLYADERITDIGLEEIKFDREQYPSRWSVTIGFHLPWQGNNPLVGALVQRPRSYKVLSIDPENGAVESVTDRLLKASQ